MIQQKAVAANDPTTMTTAENQSRQGPKTRIKRIHTNEITIVTTVKLQMWEKKSINFETFQ